MTAAQPIDMTLENTKVPKSLIRHPETFGGTAVQDCLYGDLVIRNGRVNGMKHSVGSHKTVQIVLPKLTECHVHLDKCHTIARMAGVGGDLRAAIEKQQADKEKWTPEDVRRRATRGLKELIQAGCGKVRSHLDWLGMDEKSALSFTWHVLKEIAQDHRHEVTLQLSPLIGVEEYCEPTLVENVARELAEADGVLGVFVLDQPNRRSGITAAVKAAEKYNLSIDFHVDEGLADGLDGLEIIADVILETGFQGPVLCGHACSLMNVEADPLKRLAGKILRSGVTVASLPVTNLYLQGRTVGTPDRRGVTRVRELQAMGVPVVVGSDNVRDAFCPLGIHDPIQSLMHAALAAHLDPPYGDHLPMITTTAETALGLEPTYVDGASIENLVVFDAASTADLVAGTKPPVSLSTALQGERT